MDPQLLLLAPAVATPSRTLLRVRRHRRCIFLALPHTALDTFGSYKVIYQSGCIVLCCDPWDEAPRYRRSLDTYVCVEAVRSATERRQALDGIWYTRDEFYHFFQERGPEEWRLAGVWPVA